MLCTIGFPRWMALVCRPPPPFLYNMHTSSLVLMILVARTNLCMLVCEETKSCVLGGFIFTLFLRACLSTCSMCVCIHCSVSACLAHACCPFTPANNNPFSFLKNPLIVWASKHLSLCSVVKHALNKNAGQILVCVCVYVFSMAVFALLFLLVHLVSIGSLAS